MDDPPRAAASICRTPSRAIPSAAAMSSFCADTTSRKLSNSGRSQRLFNTLARPPAHFPEIGLEPGGFLEDRDQLGLAGGRGVEIGEEVQVRPRFRRDLLVWHTGISSIQTR